MDDAELLRRFEDCSLDSAVWTHEAHLRVTYLYARDLPEAEALEAVRRGIQRFNASKGVEQTETGGYHETLTVAWFRIVRDAARGMAAAADSVAFVRARPELLEKKVPLRYYRRETIMSWAARAGFVEPDVEELPG